MSYSRPLSFKILLDTIKSDAVWYGGWYGGMPKKIVATAKEVLKWSRQEGFHAVGNPPGLGLEVKGASRLWMLRTVINGQRRKMSLGRFDDYSLEQARELARIERTKILEGRDPLDERQAAKLTKATKAAKLITFDQCAEKYIAAHESGWANAKHAQQWRNTLATYASPLIGQLPIMAIDTALIMQILEPIWQSKTETASRLRGRLEAIIDWAAVRKYREGENPARWKGHLQTLLVAKHKIMQRRNQPALPYPQIAAFMAALRAREGFGARALELAILCASRSVEVRGAQWPEFDLENRIWSIPAGRMKMKRPHRVPLSAAAAELLDALPRLANTTLVFPGLRNHPLSDATLNATIGRLHQLSLESGSAGWLEGADPTDPTRERRIVVQHGFRSTFRDWAAEQTVYPRELAETALAHVVGNQVEMAYQRGDLLEKRRLLMADWAEYCRPSTTSDPISAPTA